MARIKKQSSGTLEQAAARAAGLKSIDPLLDLGNGLTLAAYVALIESAQAKLSAYNTCLSQADEASNAFQAEEAKVADMSERMLAGVKAKHGSDSDQYEAAGGTKRSDRRRKATNKTSSKSTS